MRSTFFRCFQGFCSRSSSSWCSRNPNSLYAPPLRFERVMDAGGLADQGVSHPGDWVWDSVNGLAGVRGRSRWRPQMLCEFSLGSEFPRVAFSPDPDHLWFGRSFNKLPLRSYLTSLRVSLSKVFVRCGRGRAKVHQRDGPGSEDW